LRGLHSRTASEDPRSHGSDNCTSRKQRAGILSYELLNALLCNGDKMHSSFHFCKYRLEGIVPVDPITITPCSEEDPDEPETACHNGHEGIPEKRQTPVWLICIYRRTHKNITVHSGFTPVAVG
jgi:hypothetical protein